jgi:nucleotide-binding universal stress UspA family protein
MGDDGPVLVAGVDGSRNSMDALRWAVRQAELTGGRVYAVIVWRLPVSYGLRPPTIPTSISPNKHARRSIAPWPRPLAPRPEVPVGTRVLEGHPAQVLTEATRDADLLVVGSRGHGAFAGKLLGSVSQHCVQHARCPVVVVRSPDAARTR